MSATPAPMVSDAEIRVALRAVKRAAEQTEQSAWFPVKGSDWEVRAYKMYARPGQIVRFAWSIHFEARRVGEQVARIAWSAMSEMSYSMRQSDRARQQGKVIRHVPGHGFCIVDA